MDIKNIFFVQPCIVEFVNEENLSERKLIFFDFQKKAVINPFVDGKKLDYITKYEDLLLVSQKINKILSNQKKDQDEELDIILEKQTILNSEAENFSESKIDELRETKL